MRKANIFFPPNELNILWLICFRFMLHTDFVQCTHTYSQYCIHRLNQNEHCVYCTVGLKEQIYSLHVTYWYRSNKSMVSLLSHTSMYNILHACIYARIYIEFIFAALSLILSITVGLCTDQYWRNRDVPFRANHIAFGLLLYWGWQPVSVCLSNSNKKRWCHSMCGYFLFTSHCSMECFDTFFFFFASFDSFFILCVTLCCFFSNPRHQQFGYFENYFTQFSVEYSYDENVPIHVVCCIWWICFANA